MLSGAYEKKEEPDCFFPAHLFFIDSSFSLLRKFLVPLIFFFPEGITFFWGERESSPRLGMEERGQEERFPVSRAKSPAGSILPFFSGMSISPASIEMSFSGKTSSRQRFRETGENPWE